MSRLSDLCKEVRRDFGPWGKKNHRHRWQPTKETKKKQKLSIFTVRGQLVFDFEQISLTTSSAFLTRWVEYVIQKCSSVALFLSVLNFTTYSHILVLNKCYLFPSEKNWYCIVFLGCNKQITCHLCLENYCLCNFQKFSFVTMTLNLTSLVVEYTPECMGMK